MNQPKYCLEIWGRDYDRIKDTCILAEELGYYGYFYGESLTNLDLDCWTVLSTLIPITKTIKLGPVITYINPDYRSLALLAKQSITFQDISNGRLEFRTGAGAKSKYSVSWWDPYGIDYPEPQKRIAIFEEGLSLFRKYIGRNFLVNFDKNDIQSPKTQKEIDRSDEHSNAIYHDGKYFRATGAEMEKSVPDIPITIAANGTKMMRIAARFADIWESSYLTPMEFSAKNRKFEEMSKQENSNKDSKTRGNPNSSPKRSIELDVIIANSNKELQDQKKVLAVERGPKAYRQVLQKGLVGTPKEIQSKISAYIKLGIDQFFLAFQDPLDPKSMELFMQSVKGVK